MEKKKKKGLLLPPTAFPQYRYTVAAKPHPEPDVAENDDVQSRSRYPPLPLLDDRLAIRFPWPRSLQGMHEGLWQGDPERRIRRYGQWLSGRVPNRVGRG